MIGQIVYSSYYRGLSYTDALNKRYLFMNGQAVLRSAYPDLSLLWPSGEFGSDATYIVIPDVRETYWRGADIGRGADVDRASRTAISGSSPTGDNLGSLQGAEMKTHVHVSGTTVKTGNTVNQGGANYASWYTSGNTPTTSIQFLNPSGIVESGTVSSAFDVGNMSYFPYIGAD